MICVLCVWRSHDPSLKNVSYKFHTDMAFVSHEQILYVIANFETYQFEKFDIGLAFFLHGLMPCESKDCAC